MFVWTIVILSFILRHANKIKPNIQVHNNMYYCLLTKKKRDKKQDRHLTYKRIIISMVTIRYSFGNMFACGKTALIINDRVENNINTYFV